MPLASFRRKLAAGVALGAASWLALATLEYSLWSLPLQFSRSYCSDTSLVWRQELPFLALYPIIGAAIGAATAVACHLLRRKVALLRASGGSPFFVLVASMSLALATSAGVAAQVELRGVGRAMCLAPLAVALGLGAVAYTTLRGHRAGLAGNAWFISAVLLGAPWVATRSSLPLDPRIPIYGSALLCLTLLVAIALRRQTSERLAQLDQGQDIAVQFPSAISPTGRLLWTAGAAAIAVLSAVYLDLTAHLPAPDLVPSAADARHPNVILIVLDTARAQNFSLYGYPRATTPALTNFSHEATVYSHAIAASNYTLSSHASLFTGLLPTSHGAHPLDPALRHQRPDGEPGLADRFVTLAEVLSARGYFTAASIANYLFLSQGYKLDQGFQRFAVLSYRCAAPSPRPLLRQMVARFGGRSNLTAWTPYHNAAQVNDDVLALLDKLARRNQRFFLFANFMDTHFPYSPPPPFDSLFPGKGRPLDRDAYFDLRDAVLRGDRVVTGAERQHLLSQYDGALAYLDKQLDRLIGELKRQHTYDNSLIIITADHGEAFGEKGYVEHGTSTYQDQIHVPLIIKYPRSERRGIVGEFVSGIDIMPTVLQVLGLTPPAEVQGRGLLSLDGKPRTIISESFPRKTFQHFGPRFQRVTRAVFEGPLKLISSSAATSELYDLRADPLEERNLYGAHVGEGLELQAKLDAWLAGTFRQEGGAPVTDPETLERLRSLGYVR